MILEPIGLFTVFIGLIGFFAGPRFTIAALLLSTLLGAAAAAIVPVLGGANVQPSHVLLGFGLVSILLHRRYLAVALRSLKFPHLGFWLFCTAVYGVMVTAVMPQMFAGLTEVFSIARNGTGGPLTLAPLTPASGNLTQMGYFAADVICFLMFYAFSSEHRNVVTFARTVIACAFINVGFGIVDVVTYWVGATDVLSVIRNANYAMLYAVELDGFKRISGSFTEASAFASMTLWLFAFTGRLCIAGFAPAWSGIAAMLSLAALIATTSSTGYAGLFVYVVIEYVVLCWYLVRRQATRLMALIVLFAPVVLAVATAGAALHDDMWHTIKEIYQIAFINKMTSSSGIERTAWNAQALINIVDTMGLGVGVGATRTSSWLIAVPVNLGIIGSLTYLGFVAAILMPGRGRDGQTKAFQDAARAACLTQLIVASIGGAFIDLGLPFFMCAAVAVATPNVPRGKAMQERSKHLEAGGVGQAMA